jgi:hypothetical protein
MDGRKHPDLNRWTPTGSGHSIGRIENGELVADTVGIVPVVVTAGGWRTPQTHLIERFVVSADGKHLTIKYRWEDPLIYRNHTKYHTNSTGCGRQHALEYWCDASDPQSRVGEPLSL